MSAIWKRKVNKGATLRMGFVPEHRANGVDTPIDLTGATFRFRILHDASHEAREFDVTVADGRINVVLTADETDSFVDGRRYYYHLDMNYPSGDVKRIIEGPIFFNETGN